MKRLATFVLPTLLVGVIAICLSWAAAPALAQVAPSATQASTQAKPQASTQASAQAQAQRPTFEQLDTDKSGGLTLEEVMVYAKKQTLDLRGFAIKDVDKNHDGFLGQEELRAAGIKGLENHDVINLKDLDTNGDGYVSREELQEYIRRRYASEFHRTDADQDGVVRPREFAIFRF